MRAPGLAKRLRAVTGHGNLKLLMSRLEVQRGALAGGFGLLAASQVATLVMPLALRQMLDVSHELGSEAGRQRFAGRLLLLIALFVGQAFSDSGRTFLFARAAESSVCRLQLDLYRHLQSLPVSFFAARRPGELTARITGSLTRLRRTIGGDLPNGVRHAIVLVGSMALMVALNWRLTLVAVASFLVAGLGIGLLLKSVKAAARAAEEAGAKTSGLLSEILGNIPVIKAFAREEHELGRVEDALTGLLSANLHRERRALLLLPLGNLVGFAALVGVLLFGLGEIARGESTAGTLLAYLMYVGLMATALGQLSNLLGRIAEGLGALEGVAELFREEPENLAPEGSFRAGIGSIRLEDVTFAYPGATKPAVAGISLTLRPGETVALVGPSGAGKSTLLHLLLGFYRPQSGAIHLDDVPLSPLAVRHCVGIIFQEPYLFSRSIRDNIRYGRLDAGDDEIEEAARNSQAWEFIAGLPQGLDTVLGPNGTGLSAGQKQRLAIARALLKRSQLLILDEATSALDSTNESRIQTALRCGASERITLVVAHRLATVQDADRIVVLADGKIIESGSHNALIARGGLYADLVQQQHLLVRE